MTFAQYAARSVADARVLVEIDIGTLNLQWVNHGAGLWAVNSDNTYAWVDATLLDGFTAQNFAAIGSVTVDGVQQAKTTSMLSMVAATESFWWDSAGETLWCHFIDNTDPWSHTISIGVVFGYSFDEFTPVGAGQLYQGRLLGSPVISKRRDPLYFGKLTFGGGSITLNNGDATLDEWAEDNDIYGNAVRVKLGYDGLDIHDYELLYHGYVEKVTIGEETLTVQVADKRKQLTAPIEYVCTSLNALDAIVGILKQAYGVSYTDTYFDTAAWASAQGSVETVSYKAERPEPVITIIESICRSVFGVFFITPDNRYSFRLVDTAVSSQTTIKAADIINRHTLVYDPTEVISSARIGYWTSPGTLYDYSTNTAYQASVFNTYKTYNERVFDTLLDTATAATAYGTTIMQYAKDVHPQLPVQVPMAYYSRDIAENVDVEIQRATHVMLGTKKAEILEVRYNLDGPTMTLGLRVI